MGKRFSLYCIADSADESDIGPTGVHKHDGNQLVVILQDATLVYQEGGKEEERQYKAGDVFWIDAVEHNHKAVTRGGAVIVTIK